LKGKIVLKAQEVWEQNKVENLYFQEIQKLSEKE
jgi:hypothetical protein